MFEKKFVDAIKQKCPYPKDHNRDLGSQKHIIMYEIENLLTLMDVNVPYIHERLDRVLDVIEPPPKLGGGGVRCCLGLAFLTQISLHRKASTAR